MSLLCTLTSHAAVGSVMGNQGFAFSRCHRCGSDLVRSLNSSEGGWQEVPVGFRVSWRDVDQSIFAMTSGFSHLGGLAARAGRSAIAGVVRLAGILWALAVRVLLTPARLMRRSVRAGREAARAASAGTTMLAWKCGDTVRLGVQRLRGGSVERRRVIRLGEQQAGAQYWNLVIKLNVQPSRDGLVGDAWIEQPVRI